MKYKVKYTSQFKKELKAAVKRGYDPNEIHYVIDLIADGTNSEVLCSQYKDHSLKGKWQGYRECHIRPDWLLIYELVEDVLVLSLARTGTHSDLFNH